MSPRRPDPTPHPIRNRQGKVTGYQVRFRLGRAPNRIATSRVFTTRRDADDFCADIRDFGTAAAVNRLEARIAGAAPGGPTLAEVFEEFVQWKRSRVRSSRTVEDYHRDWKTIEPMFGRRPVETITEADVQRWVDGMVAGRVAPTLRAGELVPVSPKTIANRHGLFHSILKFAAMPSRGYVTGNACAGTDLPKRRKGRIRGLRPGEWAALYAALRQLDPDAADLALALAGTGARLGEITALSVFDVEEEQDGRVFLNIGHVIRREAGGKFRRVEDTKSEAGFRRVGVDEELAAMLRRRVAAADRTYMGGLIFTNSRGRYWLPSTFYLPWRRAIEVAQLAHRPTPHELRHTHSADLLRAGAPMAEVQARIGHEHISTTVDVYARTVTDVQSDVLERIARARRGLVGAAHDRPLVEGPVVAGEVI